MKQNHYHIVSTSGTMGNSSKEQKQLQIYHV